MNWKLITDGTPHGTKLVDAATGEKVAMQEGMTAVVDLHVNTPQHTPVVPESIKRDLESFRRHGKGPPPEYQPFLPPSEPHRPTKATVRFVPKDHKIGKLGSFDVPVEVVGDPGSMAHHGMPILG